MVIEIRAKQANGTEHRWPRHIDQRAVSFAAIEIEYLLTLVEKRRVAFALLDAVEHRDQHIRLHTTGWTLPTRFLCEEFCKLERFLNHASTLSIKAHDTAAEGGSRL